MVPGPDEKRLGRVAVDPEALERLGGSLDLLRSRGSAVAEAFSALLFQRYPALRGVFSVDPHSPQRRLIDALNIVVEHVRDPQQLATRLQELGRQHRGDGARREHDPMVCEVLVECLARELSPVWSDQLRAEWTQALELVSRIMSDGADAPLESQRTASAPRTDNGRR
jgi:hemoglobin-like flavoprotein